MTREEAIKVLSESIHDGSKVPWDKIVEAVHLSIEALSQPSLPSNLDEASHSYAWEKQEHHIDFDGDEYFDYGTRYDAFKAGAEWMAGQGVISEGKVFTSAFTSYVKTPGIEELLKDAFPEDTEVIVQIRKKQ